MKYLNKFHREKKRDKIKITFSALIIIFLFILSSYIFSNYEPNIQEIIGLKSVASMGLYILVFILSIVFAPISSMPLIPIGTKIWGIAITTILSTAGWTIGAMIAFNLSRKYGRPYVAKIIPLKKIEKIEKLIPQNNIFWTIFFLRMVTPFDGLSYVLGLATRVEPKIFFWSTFLGLIPFCLTFSFLGSLPTSYLIIGFLLASIFFIFGLYRINQKQKIEYKLKK